MRTFTAKELAEAAELALANATELREEAALLLKHGSAARAYALCHTALEELAKIPMTVRLATDAELGIPVDWRKFGRRFRQHAEKIEMHAVHDYLRTEYWLDGRDYEEFLDDLSRTKAKLRTREASLYVDFGESGGFVKPSDRITAEDANALLAEVDHRLEFYAETLPGIAEAHRRGFTEEQKAKFRAEYELLLRLSEGNTGATRPAEIG